MTDIVVLKKLFDKMTTEENVKIITMKLAAIHSIYAAKTGCIRKEFIVYKCGI